MWTKICANTSLLDAQLAADLGADALGFIFARSSRRITPAQAAAITPHLPARIERIGVFDSQDASEILAVVEIASLTGVQLHGALDLKLIRHLHLALGSRVTLIQAIHWETDPHAPSPAQSVREQLRKIRAEALLQRVLIDSRVAGATGGTGVAFNWPAASELLQAELGALDLIVAGGLRPDNVTEAIHSLAPFGVDVASGVESSPGIKDPEKLKAFLRKALVSSLPV